MDRNRVRSRAWSAPQLDEGVDVGLEDDFSELPALVHVGDARFYLVEGQAGYQLLSTVCPHKGGEVQDAGESFRCPKHGWQFDHLTGGCLNAPGEGLTAIPVTVRDGHLIADMRAPSRPFVAPRHAPRHVGRVEVRLHAHACLELVHDGVSVLTDPWLDGPAFLGAWTQNPPTVVDVDALTPDAICVTHEHSDHFHLPTLERFDRATPIFVPDFPNRRMVQELDALGFERVTAMAFGETYELAPGFTATCFEPASLWNDAIVLFDIDGFRLLNLNDAGLNQRVASRVAPVDVIASAFSPGASGFPLTWSHIEEEAKRDMLERARRGAIQMLEAAARLYRGRHVLPFASHFALWHPSHREFARALPRNTMSDVRAAFEHSQTQVIDMLPGDAFDSATGSIARGPQCEPDLHDADRLVEELERRFEPEEFDRHHPTATDLTRGEVEAYLLRLNETPDIAFCEDLTARLLAPGAAEDVDLSFALADGRLSVLDETLAEPHLRMEVPAGVLGRIVRENLSWDEAHIGYWCRFSRSPDMYHAGFWRLLQAPYFARPGGVATDHVGISEDSVVGELIERHGAQADRIMRRYGLYCVGCHRSTSDTLAAGADAHGLDARQRSRLVRELNHALA